MLKNLLALDYHLLYFAKRRRHVADRKLAAYFVFLQLFGLFVYISGLCQDAFIHAVERLMELVHLDVEAVKHIVERLAA